MALQQVVENVDNVAFFVFFGFLLVWGEIVALKQAVYQRAFFLDYIVLAVILVITVSFLYRYYQAHLAR